MTNLIDARLLSLETSPDLGTPDDGLDFPLALDVEWNVCLLNHRRKCGLSCVGRASIGGKSRAGYSSLRSFVCMPLGSDEDEPARLGVLDGMRVQDCILPVSSLGFADAVWASITMLADKPEVFAGSGVLPHQVVRCWFQSLEIQLARIHLAIGPDWLMGLASDLTPTAAGVVSNELAYLPVPLAKFVSGVGILEMEGKPLIPVMDKWLDANDGLNSITSEVLIDSSRFLAMVNAMLQRMTSTSGTEYTTTQEWELGYLEVTPPNCEVDVTLWRGVGKVMRSACYAGVPMTKVDWTAAGDVGQCVTSFRSGHPSFSIYKLHENDFARGHVIGWGLRDVRNQWIGARIRSRQLALEEVEIAVEATE